MTPTFRAYLSVGGRTARRTARRLFLRYGIRPRLIARHVSLADLLFPFWAVNALPTDLPDDLLLQALLETATREHDDRPAVLYLCDDTSLLPYFDLLESSFVVRRTDGSILADPNRDVKEARPS